MKKRILTLVAALFLTTSMFAQFEVKVNPIGLLFGGISASGEYILSDNMGVEVSANLLSRKASFLAEDAKLTGFGFGAAYKYYFSPEDGGDKFYANVYARYGGQKSKFDDGAGQQITANYSVVAVGFGVGYKWVADSGLLFELGLGAGRNLAQNWTLSDGTDNYDFPNWGFDLTGKLAIGWRF